MPEPDFLAEGRVVISESYDPAALRLLASADCAQPPFDFAEFQRRSLLRQGRRSAGWLPSTRVTALAASLSAVLIGAALWRYVSVPQAVTAVAGREASVREDSPALVQAGHLAARAELEERIAVIDAMLSESRVSGLQQDRLSAMERGRSQLVDSLQRVAYAQQLIEP